MNPLSSKTRKFYHVKNYNIIIIQDKEKKIIDELRNTQSSIGSNNSNSNLMMRLEIKTPLPPVIKKNEMGKHTKNSFNTTQNKKKEKKDLNEKIKILKKFSSIKKISKKRSFYNRCKIKSINRNR